MNRRFLDVSIVEASSLATLDKAIYDLATTSAISHMQQNTAELLETSDVAAMQQLKEAAQKFAPAFPPTPESALSLGKNCIATQALEGTAAQYLETLRHTATAKDTAIQILQDMDATAVKFATEGLLGIAAKQQGLLSDFAKQLDYTSHFVKDSLSYIAKDSLADFRGVTTLWDDQLAQSARDLVNSYRVLQDGQRDLFSTAFRHLEEQLREARSLAFPSVAGMAEQISEAFRLQLPASVLGATFTGELLDRLQRAETATSEAERENVLDELFVWFIKKFSELPQNLLTWLSAHDVFWNIVIPFIFYLALNRDAVTKDDLFELEQRLREDSLRSEQRCDERTLQLEQRLEEQISRAQEEILQKLEEHRQTSYTCRHYVSTKQVILREKPESRARLIKKLGPNVIFEEIEEKREWLLVEVFDYGKGEFKRGWIFKKNLLLVEDKEISCREENQ